MKLFVIFSLFYLSFLPVSLCQLPNGSIAPDFTLKDIDGNTHHLYDYLDSGKVVIIDFFEVMCGPCWIYHETHALAQAYNAWGPQGTNELMVFEVEGIKSSVNQIRGLQPPTNGNWTAGEPFPFIATCQPNGDQITRDYMVNFFPTVYMICRDRRLKLIGRADTSVIHTRMNECPSAPNDSLLLDLLKIDSAKTVTCSNSVHPYLKFQNYGTNTIHNAVISASMDNQAADMLTWSGNLKTYDVIQIDGKHFTQVSDGSHTIKYYLSELNGSSTGFIRDTISMRYTCVQNNIQLPYFQDFSDPGFPYDKWTINNPYETIPTWERAELGYSHALRIPYYNIPSEYKSALYLPALSFLGNEKPCLRFDLACSHNNSTIHQAGYDLIVFSYSLDCGITWNLLTQLSSLDHQTAPDDSTYFVPTETQWKSMSIDLTKIANKESVIIMLASDPADGNNMYLRNIKFDNTATVNEKNSHEMVQVYPIPAKDILCIKFTRAMNGTRFDLYNCIGSKVASTNHPGGKEASLMLPDLLPGCYFLQVVTQEFTVTRKIMIE